MRNFIDMASTIIVTGVAVVMLVVYVGDRSGSQDPSDRYEEGWKQWQSGIRLGSAGAPVTVDVFMDFTCPHCGRVVPVLDSVRAEYSESVAVRYHYFPLRDQGPSIESAVAAECAREQGKFETIYHSMYAAQDSLGLRTWESYAADAGVPDLPRFRDCMGRPVEDFERIVDSRYLVETLGLRGTPTIWVNGSLFDEGRTFRAFAEKVEELGHES